MKKLFRILALGFAVGMSVGWVTGCAAKNTVQVLPAGAIDQVDATSNTVIQTAYAFAKRITEDHLSTDPAVHIDLTATQLTALNKLNASINVASQLEQAYHANPSAPALAALQAALPAVSANFGSAQAAIPVPTAK